MKEKEFVRNVLIELSLARIEGRQWASMEIVRFPLESRAVIRTGVIHTDGTKELCIKTRVMSLRHDTKKYSEHDIIHT